MSKSRTQDYLTEPGQPDPERKRRAHDRRRRALTLATYAEIHRAARAEPEATTGELAAMLARPRDTVQRALSRTMADWRRRSRKTLRLRDVPEGDALQRRRAEQRVRRAGRAHALRREHPAWTIREIAEALNQGEGVTQGDLARPPVAWRQPRRQAPPRQSIAQIRQGMRNRIRRAFRIKRAHPDWSPPTIARRMGSAGATLQQYLAFTERE